MTKVEGPNVALTARPVDMAWPHGLALARQGRGIIELSVAESVSLGEKNVGFCVCAVRQLMTWQFVQWSLLVRSALCQMKMDHTSGLTLYPGF